MSLLVNYGYDRQMLLWAVNGREQPTHVSSIQVRKLSGKDEDYRMYPVDTHYLELIMRIKKEGFVLVETETLPDCRLKGIYEDNNVYWSLWVYMYYVTRKDLDGVGGHLFMSHAVMKPEKPTAEAIRAAIEATRRKAMIFQEAAQYDPNMVV